MHKHNEKEISIFSGFFSHDKTLTAAWNHTWENNATSNKKMEL